MNKIQKDIELAQNKKKVLVVEKPEIVVHGTKEKPYFEIKYKELGEDDYTLGYSSYSLDFVFQWLEEYFEVVEETVSIEAEKISKIISFEDKMNICRCCQRYLICANLHNSKCPVLIKKIERAMLEEGKEKNE